MTFGEHHVQQTSFHTIQLSKGNLFIEIFLSQKWAQKINAPEAACPHRNDVSLTDKTPVHGPLTSCSSICSSLHADLFEHIDVKIRFSAWDL